MLAYTSPAAVPADDPLVRRGEVYADTCEAADAAWTLLHEEIVGRSAADGVKRVRSIVREDYPAVRRLVAAGYRVSWESWSARLHLDGLLADDAFASIVAGAKDEVVEVGSERHKAAYELFAASVGDFPWTPATAQQRYDLAEFTERLGKSRAFGVFRESDGACLALTVATVEKAVDAHDDARAARAPHAAHAARAAHAAHAETDFTVVAADARQRGLAKLVKAVAVRTLAAEGVRTFGTGGAAVNAASLRMNLALGYVRDPGWRTYELVL